ncbi:S-layer homology domain-containing protein [Candidatus Peregrinibacteria bacterium]|nr:S-layer homology domain-containing protein [Candidatus Peregrinibacteria bacterium]
MKKFLKVSILCLFGIFIFSQAAFAFLDGYDYYSGSYDPSWDVDYESSTWTPSFYTDNGSDYSGTYGDYGTKTGNVSSSGGTPVPAGDYGVPGLTIPEGAIGVEGWPSGDVYCLEKNSNSTSSLKAYGTRINFTDRSIYHCLTTTTEVCAEQKDVGEITVYDNKLPLEYGYIYPLVDPATGKVYHSVTNELIVQAYYDKTKHAILYMPEDGKVTDDLFGMMLTDTTGYVNMDPGYFDLAKSSDSYSDGFFEYNNSFLDVPAGEWFYDPVRYAAAKGWVKYDDNFRPTDGATRCEFSKMLLEAHEVDVDGSHVSGFTDVPADHWAAPYVYTGVDAGYWSGVGGGKFGCDDPVTREQAAKMIANVVGFTKDSVVISDAEDEALFNFIPSDEYSDWALPYIRVMSYLKFMNDKDGAFDAKVPFSRAMAVTVFYRIFADPAEIGDPDGF